MNVLVTGGAGFIGRNLVRHLAAQRHDIVVLDDFSRHAPETVAEIAAHPGVTMQRGDITRPGAFDALTAVDRVYHLAGVVGVRRVAEDPLRVMRVNTLATLFTCDWFARVCGPDARMLYSSTSEVYGGSQFTTLELPVPTPEDVPLVIADTSMPRFSYAMSKMWGEMYCRYTAAASSRIVRTVRYHNVYGPAMGFEHVIPQVVQRIAKREDPFSIWGGDETRAFCWIDDAVEATIRVMEAAPAPHDDLVHIGTDDEVTVRDLYTRLFHVCGWTPATMVDAGSAVGSPSRRCPDVSRLRALTGYMPGTSLDEGLVPTAAWYLEHRA
jgi:nucleoside-diphosphate-sugar epimerase